jgi:hypothetical protein
MILCPAKTATGPISVPCRRYTKTVCAGARQADSAGTATE